MNTYSFIKFIPNFTNALYTIVYYYIYILPVPELPPHKKQAYPDSKRDSKITKINFPVAHIKFSVSPILEACPQASGTYY
jgi:hypothetical protein